MINETRIGSCIVREHGEVIHVELPSGRVAVVDGGNYRAFGNEVYAALRVAGTVAERALYGFLERRGVQLV